MGLVVLDTDKPLLQRGEFALRQPAAFSVARGFKIAARQEYKALFAFEALAEKNVACSDEDC